MQLSRRLALAGGLHLLAASLASAQLTASGAVTDPDGRPLAGARIELVRPAGDFESGVGWIETNEVSPSIGGASTDLEGRYTLTVPEVGFWTLKARAQGRVPMQLGPLAVTGPEELPPLILSPSSEARLQLRDHEGEPVAGAWVLATGETSGSKRPPRVAWRPDLRLTRSGVDGGAMVPRGKDESLDVSIFPSGLPEVRRQGVTDGLISLAPPTAERVLVRVLGAALEPVPRVLVRIGEHSWPAGLTDQRGEIVLAIPRDQPLPVRLVATDGSEARIRLEAGLPSVEVRLAAPILLEGRILDQRTGRGIPGALVAPTTAAGAVVRTTNEGRYRLPLPRRGRWTLEAHAPSYLGTRFSLEEGAFRRGRAPAVALEPAARLRGRVTTTEGAPLPGVTLVAVPESALSPRWFSAADPVAERAVTGQDGGFELARLRPARGYELRATKAGYFPAAFPALTAEPGVPTRPIAFQLTPSRGLRGRVVDQDGKPITGAELVALPSIRPGRAHQVDDQGLGSPEGPGRVAVSDPAGRFSLLESPARDIDLEIRKNGLAPLIRRSLRLPPGRGPVDLGILTLHPGLPLRGRVTDIGGRGIAGAEIFLLHRQPPAPALDEALVDRRAAATSGADGSFELPDRPLGEPHQLAVRADGYRTSSARDVRAAPGRWITIRLERSALLRGRVVAEDGSPIAEAEVGLTWQAVLVEDPERRPVGPVFQRSARTDATGRFEILDAPQGEVGLDVSARGFVTVQDRRVAVPWPDPQHELTLVLARGATLEGEVRTARGRPVPGARVLVESAAGVSDAEGWFSVEGAEPGERLAEVFHPDFRPLRRTVLIEPRLNRVSFQLADGVEVSGRVVDEDGVPLAARVSLEASERSNTARYETTCGEGGLFRFESVAAGRYRLRARLATGPGSEQPEQLVVTDRPVQGLELVLRKGTDVRGRVLGLTEDQLALVQILATRENGGSAPAAVDAEGRYELRQLEPGDWLVRAWLWDGQRQAQARVIVAPTDREIVRDLEFEPRPTLSGRVLFEGEPLPETLISVRGEGIGRERQVLTGWDGRFRLEDLPADRYWLGVSNPARRLTHNDTVELTEDLDLEIQLEASTLGGRVTDAEAGEPIGGAQISLRPLQGPDFVIAGGSDLEGRFHFLHVPSGEYRLLAKAAHHAPAEQEVAVHAGEDRLDLELALARTDGVRLTVRLASGSIPQVVHLLALDSAGATVLAETRQVGRGGEVELSSLPPGSWRLIARAPGSATSTAALTVPGDPVGLILPDAARLELRVPALVTADLAGSAQLLDPSGAPLWILEPGAGLLSSWSLRAGQASVDGVPPGAWRIEVRAAGGQVWSTALSVGGPGTLTVTLD